MCFSLDSADLSSLFSSMVWDCKRVEQDHNQGEEKRGAGDRQDPEEPGQVLGGTAPGRTVAGMLRHQAAPRAGRTGHAILNDSRADIRHR